MTAVIQGQQTYNQFPAFAQPGQLADLAYNEIEGYPAVEVINPGRQVMLAADGLSCQQAQQSGADNQVPNCLGVAVLITARESGGAFGITPYGVGGPQYNIGDTVPVLSRGRIYGEWNGTTQTAFKSGANGSGPLHVYSSSTVATNRGQFTDVAVSTVAGSEVSYAGAQFSVRQALPGSGNIVLLDVNLPGAS